MNVDEAFDELMKFTHFWNWAPDWTVCKNIYETIPDSYSVLSPFAYCYLEELIRSTTSEYGRVHIDVQGKKVNRKVGYKLIELAIKENKVIKPEYVLQLEVLKKYYVKSKSTDIGDNRNSVAHGYMHPRFWDKESFENLIIDIANISKFSGF